MSRSKTNTVAIRRTESELYASAKCYQRGILSLCTEWLLLCDLDHNLFLTNRAIGVTEKTHLGLVAATDWSHTVSLFHCSCNPSLKLSTWLSPLVLLRASSLLGRLGLMFNFGDILMSKSSNLQLVETTDTRDGYDCDNDVP